MFVYVLKNASMPGLYKIGRSAYPDRRVAEISSATGVPTPFEIVAMVDCESAAHSQSAEEIAHRMLASFRVNAAREFFELEHENHAIQAIHIAAIAAKGFLVPSEVIGLLSVVRAYPPYGESVMDRSAA